MHVNLIHHVPMKGKWGQRSADESVRSWVSRAYPSFTCSLPESLPWITLTSYPLFLLHISVRNHSVKVFSCLSQSYVKDLIPLVSVPHTRNSSYKRIHISNSPHLEPKEENHISLKNAVFFTYHIFSSLASRKQILFPTSLGMKWGI